MKIENIPADIKSKSLKEAKEEINEILVKLETQKLDFNSIEITYKRLMSLNKHVENIFKIKSKKLSSKEINFLKKYKPWGIILFLRNIFFEISLSIALAEAITPE